MMTGLACAVCGHSNGVVVFSAKGLEPGDPPFHVRRCPHCGLGWTEPRVPETQIGRWYPPSYYGKGNVRFNIVFELLVRLFRRRRANVIARRASKGPILDVGCGRGRTLGYLKTMGFTPHGVEMTEDGAWHAKTLLNIPVHVGPFAQTRLPSGNFSAVIFWHSLEHMSDPIQTLRQAKDLLRPGGLLVTAVPNFNSLQAKCFGSSWFHLDIPRHYFHFSEDSLRRVLESLGFRIVQLDHFSLEQNPYGWLQSFYNSMGMQFNFLYSILKNRTSRIISLKEHPIQAMAAIALVPVFLPLSLALTLLEALLRRGGTMELYAIKQ